MRNNDFQHQAERLAFTVRKNEHMRALADSETGEWANIVFLVCKISHWTEDDI